MAPVAPEVEYVIEEIKLFKQTVCAAVPAIEVKEIELELLILVVIEFELIRLAKLNLL